MAKVVSQKVSFEVGQNLSCLYPIHGNRNILKTRKGKIERSGVGPHGQYATVQLLDGSYRTFREDRMVDAVNA